MTMVCRTCSVVNGVDANLSKEMKKPNNLDDKIEDPGENR